MNVNSIIKEFPTCLVRAAIWVQAADLFTLSDASWRLMSPLFAQVALCTSWNKWNWPFGVFISKFIASSSCPKSSEKLVPDQWKGFRIQQSEINTCIYYIY